MITVAYSRGPLRVVEVFFPEEYAALPTANVDLLCVTQASFAVPGAIHFPTQIIDLLHVWDDVEAGMKKAVRYEARRAASADGARVDITPAPNEREAADFLTAYAVFAHRRGLGIPPAARWRALVDSGGLVLARTDVLGVPTVRHAYLTDGQRIRLLLSFAQGVGSAASGRANRLTHLRVAQWAQRAGIAQYDLGGLALDNPGLAGIDAFKMSFGGIRVDEFSWTGMVTLRGRAVQGLRKALRKSP